MDNCKKTERILSEILAAYQWANTIQWQKEQ